MLLSVSRETTELNEQQGWCYFWLLTLKLSDVMVKVAHMDENKPLAPSCPHAANEKVANYL